LEIKDQNVNSRRIKRAIAIGFASAVVIGATAPLAGGQSTLGASIMDGRGSGVAWYDNKGPDEYYAPRYRNGKCVEDEGNPLVAEPPSGAGARRMEGKSLERALASLCRKAKL
jgi:hypothetical protein